MRDDYTLVERVNARPYLRKRGSSDHQKHNAIHREGVTCRSCAKYPCFKGMETITSNLAETCHSFKKK